MSRGKLKFINKTDWDTRSLRRLVELGLREEMGHYLHYEVEIYTLRENARYTGWGAIGAEWMCLGVMKAHIERTAGLDTLPMPMPAKEIRRLAKTLMHEVRHNQNEHHKDMIDSCDVEVPWLEKLLESGFEIQPKKPTKKLERDPQSERFDHAKKKLAEHEKTLKRAKKLAQKWKRKVKYYERVMANRKSSQDSP